MGRFVSTFLLRIANTAPPGSGAIHINSITLNGTSPNSFELGEEIVFPFDINANSYEQIPVDFKPDALGLRSSYIIVESSVGSLSIPVSALGTDCSYIDLSEASHNSPWTGEDVDITVSTDCTWNVSTLPNWLTLTPDTDSPTIEGDEFETETVLSVAQNNTGSSRSHTLTFTNLTNKTHEYVITQEATTAVATLELDGDFGEVII